MQYNFNIRVYGIWIQDGKILINEEKIKNRTVIKFPGGGMDYGEGTMDCLVREWKEELNMDIKVGRHFYTTDFFQKSAFDASQVISIYYFITAEVPDTIVNNEAGERTYWMDVKNISADIFTLPIDKIVGSLLQEYITNTSAHQ